MRSIDVFISHKLEDMEKVRKLQSQIVSWNFTCYVDADDVDLQKTKDPKQLSNRIRDRLRHCRCLIYAFSTRSVQSKWMPWELGFYDGRWGQKQIGLYNLDGPAAAIGSEPAPDHQPPRLTIQEYLEMYKLVKDDELRSFIHESTSIRALADRADVDVDRLTTLMEGALRNPMAFWLGCVQYGLGLQRSFWNTAGMPDDPKTIQWLAILESMRAEAEKHELPKFFQYSAEDIANQTGASNNGAIQNSVAFNK